MYEELMNIEETRRTWELADYFVVLPAYGSIYNEIHYEYEVAVSKNISKPYNSDNEQPLYKPEIIDFMIKNGLLDEDSSITEQPRERYWP